MAEEYRDWELSYYVRSSREEAERIYDAIQTLLCTCEFPREFDKDGCRVPVSGMHPVWVDSKLEEIIDEMVDEAEEERAKRV